VLLTSHVLRPQQALLCAQLLLCLALWWLLVLLQVLVAQLALQLLLELLLQLWQLPPGPQLVCCCLAESPPRLRLVPH
jgi:hypothetical protein